MKMHPESQMMSYGYNPHWSEGAIKCPIFQTSTFAFKSAEEGKAFFELAYGLREQDAGEQPGLIYSRLNNPDLEILEGRLKLWDQADDCAVFESGMSAITTVLMEFLRPGDVLLYSRPVYGGTAHFVEDILPQFGIHVLGYTPEMTTQEIESMLQESGHADRLKLIYVETPANPTNTQIDIAAMRTLANAHQQGEERPLVVVDNTYMGPIWQHPLEHGADLIMYSATKYIGGHSDVIAGAVLGSTELMQRIKTLRTFLGNMAGPWTGWLLMRSLETLKIRMDKQAENAMQVACFLQDQPKVKDVHYLGLLTEADGRQYEIYKKQCSSPGAMVSIELHGGEAEAFAFLNNLKMVKLAVSLGSTESLAQHPATMTHAGIPPEDKEAMGITENLVRLSVGVEHIEDLIQDLTHALAQIPEPSHAH